MRCFFSIVALTIAMITSALNAVAADPVTFTRHAFDEGSYIFSTLCTGDDTPFCTYDDRQRENGHYKFFLLSENVEKMYEFTLDVPSEYRVQNLYIAQSYNGKVSVFNDTYISEIGITQHLFNDDDLYEVVFRFEYYDENERHWETYHIYNESGECLGVLPSRGLYIGEDTIYVYQPYDRMNHEDYNVSSLYSINNKSGNIIAPLSITPKMQVKPNPVKGDEVVSLVLPEDTTNDMVIQVVSINGNILLREECVAGTKVINIPANNLSNGVNPVIVLDVNGNVLYSGKIVRE